MSHDEAVQSFAAEQYLLEELTVELRDEFEEHVFACHGCAVDLLAGAAFLTLMGCRRWNVPANMPHDRDNPLSHN